MQRSHSKVTQWCIITSRLTLQHSHAISSQELAGWRRDSHRIQTSKVLTEFASRHHQYSITALADNTLFLTRRGINNVHLILRAKEALATYSLPSLVTVYDVLEKTGVDIGDLLEAGFCWVVAERGDDLRGPSSVMVGRVGRVVGSGEVGAPVVRLWREHTYNTHNAHTQI